MIQYPSAGTQVHIYVLFHFVAHFRTNFDVLSYFAQATDIKIPFFM